jgi:hypothetical protein
MKLLFHAVPWRKKDKAKEVATRRLSFDPGSSLLSWNRDSESHSFLVSKVNV